MPKLPSINAQQLIKALKRMGFYEHRQKGTSHLVLKHPDGRRTVVAVHSNKDIPKGTLLAILRDAEVRREDLLINL